MRRREITIRATEHRTASEAIQHLNVSAGDRAVLVGGKYLTLSQAEAERLEATGGEFAYLSWHRPTNQIMTIPVNDH